MTIDIDDAINALLAYRQADMEGVEVLASRQAIHEVTDELRRLRTLAQQPFTSWGQFCSRCRGKDAHCYICGIRRVAIEECAKAVESDKVLGRAMGELAANVVRSLTAQEPPAVAVGMDWKLTDDAKATIAEIDRNIREAPANIAKAQRSSAGNVQERCAKIAEQTARGWVNGEATTAYGQAYQSACRHIAAAIRGAQITTEPQTAPDRVAVQKAVNYLLREGKWPEYKTYDDRGLERAEYTDFVIDVLSALPRPQEK